jgi:hypothetical protein
VKGEEAGTCTTEAGEGVAGAGGLDGGAADRSMICVGCVS